MCVTGGYLMITSFGARGVSRSPFVVFQDVWETVGLVSLIAFLGVKV